MGRKHSEETKQKLRAASRRNRENGLPGSMKGKNHSEETKKRMAAAQLGRQHGEHPWWVGAKVHHIKRNAATRQIAWSLTHEEACRLILQECSYCGEPSHPVTSSAPGWSLAGVNGIDRVDSATGYAFDNCVAACSTCNIAKAQMTVEQFYAWVTRVYSRGRVHPREREDQGG